MEVNRYGRVLAQHLDVPAKEVPQRHAVQRALWPGVWADVEPRVASRGKLAPAPLIEGGPQCLGQKKAGIRDTLVRRECHFCRDAVEQARRRLPWVVNLPCAELAGLVEDMNLQRERAIRRRHH